MGLIVTFGWSWKGYKAFSSKLCPDLLTRGSALEPFCELCPHTLIVGESSALVMVYCFATSGILLLALRKRIYGIGNDKLCRF